MSVNRNVNVPVGNVGVVALTRVMGDIVSCADRRGVIRPEISEILDKCRLEKAYHALTRLDQR
jgi:hypothetical protein